MAEDSIDDLGLLMNDIGQELVDISGGEPDSIFLYVEIGKGGVGPSVFKDDGAAVRYLRYEGHELDDLLLEAWHAVPANKRWSVMEYDIKDGKFEVSFRYPEEVDVEVLDRGRRAAALRARYGDKPVVYPPPPEGAFELKP